MSSFEKVRPGIKPLFLSQKMEQKLPEKKMPSTAAKATILSPKLVFESIQRSAHSALFFTQGMVSMALKRVFFGAHQDVVLIRAESFRE